MTALPMPTQVVDRSNRQPNCPAYPAEDEAVYVRGLTAAPEADADHHGEEENEEQDLEKHKIASVVLSVPGKRPVPTKKATTV
mgnify:CR=1 FL=1